MDKLSKLLENREEPIKMLDFPNVRQSTEYRCGVVCVQTILVYYGEDYREDELISQVTDKNTDMSDNKKSANIPKIVQFLKEKGYSVDNKQMTIDELIRYIDRDIPVIIVLQAWEDKDDYTLEWNSGHYVVAIGYTKNKILFEDPSTFQTSYLTFKELMGRWHDQDEDTRYIQYGIAVYGKKPKFDKNKWVKIG